MGEDYRENKFPEGKTWKDYVSDLRIDKAESCLKYIKTKFVRAMLGTLKVTQDKFPESWANVPLQDFISSSDIDWSKSVAEIDQQLYKKYGLDENEFIGKMIKGME